MEMIQHVLICGECGSVQAADVPVKLCACGSDHARDVSLQLQASQLCPRCRRLHAIDLDVDSARYPERYCPECRAERDALNEECATWNGRRQRFQGETDRLELRFALIRDGFVGLVDLPSKD